MNAWNCDLIQDSGGLGRRKWGINQKRELGNIWTASNVLFQELYSKSNYMTVLFCDNSIMTWYFPLCNLYLNKDVFLNLNLFILIRGELLDNIVLVLPYINMNLPRVYTSSQSWTPLSPPSPSHPSGSSQCTSPKLPVSCIEPGLMIVSYMILYIFQCHSLKSSPPLPLPQSPKDCSIYICLSFAVSHTGLLLPSF